MNDKLRRRKPGPRLLLGDCREQMKLLEDNSVDAIVSDPPYELGFMGKKWDNSGIAYDPAVWAQTLRVLKPGGHLLAFSGTRTYHRMVVAIEDAGFEIRDQLGWGYTSGFPKGLNISKAIDREMGAEREVVGKKDRGFKPGGNKVYGQFSGDMSITAAATAEASEWDGWNTQLKPAWEPIVLARKDLAESNVALNVLEHRTGGINVDGCRIGSEGGTRLNATDTRVGGGLYGGGINNGAFGVPVDGMGRYPSNIITDGVAFPSQISRFFFSAKASKADRGGEGNVHSTVKPIALMRYLCRLITPPGGVVLDPFMGSGSTIVAARMEGFRSIGIDLLPEHLDIVRGRLDGTLNMKDDEDDPTPGGFF